MLRNYLKIAYRHLVRQKGYTAINVIGLAVAVACCVLIALYVRDELSFDAFHERAERIVFVAREAEFGGVREQGMSTPFPLAGALRDEVPGVVQSVNLTYGGRGGVSRDGISFTEEDQVVHAGPALFEIFSFPLLQGDPATVLQEPGSVVITEEVARKYFGEENPVGRTLHVRQFEAHAFTVTGVAAAVRENTSLPFDVVAALSTLENTQSNADSWRASMYRTFALLEPGVAPETLGARLAEVVRRHLGEKETDHYFAVPLKALYLSGLQQVGGFRGDPKYLYLFSAVALVILLIACINYMNLATARAAARAKEVGVRKALGAARRQVAAQFLGESVLLGLSAFVLGLGLARLALPFFNEVFQKRLVLQYTEDAGFLLFLAGLALGVGLLAGSYPAAYLSAFQPARVIKGELRRGREGALLRKALVVLQFAVAVVLLVGTAVIYRQLRYVQTKDLGFRAEQVVVVDLAGETASRQHEAIKRAFLQHPRVLRAAAASSVPGRFGVRYSMPFDRAQPERMVSMHVVKVDADLLETLGIELVAGRGFSDSLATDRDAYLLNEAAAAALGWADPVGRELNAGPPGPVLGVMENFHFASLHEEVGPVLFRMQEKNSPFPPYDVVAVRVSPEDVTGTLAFLEAQWRRFEAGEPFQYRFLDDSFAELYRTERRLGQVFGTFAAVAILLACMGLLGLAAFAAQERTKEIGIRKALGATAPDIVLLLSRDFIRLVLVGFAAAVPVAYLVMERWLEGFAYRIEVGAGTLLLAGLLALAVALLAVSYQALRAARANPVEALRYE